jgi:hypothetical protein
LLQITAIQFKGLPRELKKKKKKKLHAKTFTCAPRELFGAMKKGEEKNMKNCYWFDGISYSNRCQSSSSAVHRNHLRHKASHLQKCLRFLTKINLQKFQL